MTLEEVDEVVHEIAVRWRVEPDPEPGDAIFRDKDGTAL
jgi:hypothetical protein